MVGLLNQSCSCPRACIPATTRVSRGNALTHGLDHWDSASSLRASHSHRQRDAIIAAGKRLVSSELPSGRLVVQVAEPAPSPPPVAAQSFWQNPATICFALAALLASLLLQIRQVKPAIVEKPDLDAMDLSMSSDPRAFQRSLARTRQAAHITKAVSFQAGGEPAKAYSELSSALQENSICRRPFNCGNVTKEELVKLYQLAIRCGEVPPHWATLLQLQELLGLSQEEAERLELEVVESSASFSI